VRSRTETQVSDVPGDKKDENLHALKLPLPIQAAAAEGVYQRLQFGQRGGADHRPDH
jgi:hypothetical protein